MDFHDLTEINIEDSRKAHLKDVSVQEKYKVKYLQYWINELEGKAYCLIEGPSKEACEATHREANGITACNLVEVKGGMYDLFLGDNQKVDHGLVRHFNVKSIMGIGLFYHSNLTIPSFFHIKQEQNARSMIN